MIMKKTYMIPEMMVVRLKTISMIASTTLNAKGTTDDEDDLLSREFRHRSVWDEDQTPLRNTPAPHRGGRMCIFFNTILILIGGVPSVKIAPLFETMKPAVREDGRLFSEYWTK